jgi:hypothetical protein
MRVACKAAGHRFDRCRCCNRRAWDSKRLQVGSHPNQLRSRCRSLRRSPSFRHSLFRRLSQPSPPYRPSHHAPHLRCPHLRCQYLRSRTRHCHRPSRHHPRLRHHTRIRNSTRAPRHRTRTKRAHPTVWLTQPCRECSTPATVSASGLNSEGTCVSRGGSRVVPAQSRVAARQVASAAPARNNHTRPSHHCRV